MDNEIRKVPPPPPPRPNIPRPPQEYPKADIGEIENITENDDLNINPEDVLVKKEKEKTKGMSFKLRLTLLIMGAVLCLAGVGVCAYFLFT